MSGKILLLGPYFGNRLHGAEVGIYDALVELGYETWVFDPRVSKIMDPDKQVWESKGPSPRYPFSVVVCPGPGLPVGVTDSTWFRSLENAKKVLWNSEPVRLKNYRERVESQKGLYDFTFTFDESEISIYSKMGIDAKWLPCGFNPKWYRPLQKEAPVGDMCFVGSMGSGKWVHRENLIRRLQKTYEVTYGSIFEADKVNLIYNGHKLVLNLGLYCAESGSYDDLKAFALQQRIFEAVGAGRVCVTNRIPKGTNKLFEDEKHVLYYTKDNIEDVIEYGLDDKNRTRMEAEILKIRKQHSYKVRIAQMMEVVGV